MKNIGVFFGSGSAEHDISIITAQLVIAGLKGLGYSVTPVYITKDGKWMIGEDLGNMKMYTDPKKKVEDEKKLFEYYLDLEESVGKIVFKKKGLGGKSITVDLAFPALHGTYGEDGTMQGVFEMLGVPYVGCGVAASAIAMDKAFAKIVIADAGVPITKFTHFGKQEWHDCKVEIIGEIRSDLKWPVFVKPVHLGSSIGIAKVKDQDMDDLARKIDVAMYYDDKVLVEEGVENLMDVTCCVIGNEELTASELQESIYSSEMLDFDDKYVKGGGAQTGNAQGGFVIPATLDEATTKNIQEAAKKVYKALGCSGIARVDFLYNKDSKKFFANEVNPLPGTLYHHLWKASGMELDELLKNLIKFAEEKYEQRKQINFTFESSVLKNLGGGKMKGGKLK